MSLIDALVVVGIGIVLPLALGGRYWWWATSAAGTAAAFLLASGVIAALLIAPALVAIAVVGINRLRAREDSRLEWVLAGLPTVYALVGVLSLMQSRAGLDFARVGEPIVELTAVHYIYAGCGALVLALAARAASPGWPRLGWIAVLLTAAAPPVVAFGFLARDPWAQTGGAVLISLGVWSTAALQIREALAENAPKTTRLLLAASGLAVIAPMVLAISWAAGQHWDVPALSIPAMVRLHGIPNALGFTLAGLLARRWNSLPTRAVPE